MARLIIDSSIVIDLEREQLPGEVEAAIVAADEAAIAAITLSEILEGVHGADEARRGAKEAFVARFAAGFGVIPFDAIVARVHARLAHDLNRRGTPVGAHDLLIGATAIAHGAEVWTMDRRSFPRIPGLTVRAFERPKGPKKRR